MDTDIDNTSDARKTFIVNNELLCLKVNMAPLQETRVAVQGSIRKRSSGIVNLLTYVRNMVLALLSRTVIPKLFKSCAQ